MRWHLSLLALPVAAIATAPPSETSSFVVQCANRHGWRIVTAPHNTAEYTVECGQIPTVRINTTCPAPPASATKHPGFQPSRDWARGGHHYFGSDDEETDKKNTELMGDVEHELYLRTEEFWKSFDMLRAEIMTRRVPDEQLKWAEKEMATISGAMELLAQDLKQLGDSMEGKAGENETKDESGWVTVISN